MNKRMSAVNPPTEKTVRYWRDVVYGRPSSDENWNGCRDHWMKPESIQWLKEQSELVELKNTRR